MNALGFSPAATAARDRPSSASAIDRSRTLKMLLCRAHSACMAPRSGRSMWAATVSACSAATTSANTVKMPMAPTSPVIAQPDRLVASRRRVMPPMNTARPMPLRT